MVSKREAAMAAYDQYVIAHTEAHGAFLAEQAVSQLSSETKKLGDSAEPVKAASQGMAAPLSTSKQEEGQRQSTLGGGQTMQGPQSGMGGIVGALISKFASHGSRFKRSPNAGSPRAGEHLDRGGKLASQEAPARRQQSQDASAQQRAFLDAAIAARQQQESQLSSDQENIRTKYDEEQAILQEIRVAKGEALQRRDQHRGEVESQASGFNSDFQGLESWRQQYIAIRQRLESTE